MLRIFFLFLLLSINPYIHAEIITDGTLANTAVKNLGGTTFAITESLGITVGTNLFHSFSHFNLASGEKAEFSGSAAIKNIINRVTGGTISLIDGEIESDIANANFYFMNPAGITFGKNAKLDISGSLYVTSANQINLSDGRVFSATAPQNGVLLSTASPSSFGFLDQPIGQITFDSVKSTFKVPDQQVLAIVGGDITIAETKLRLESGRINIVSVASAGNVSFSANGITTDNQSHGTVNITSNSELDADGSGKDDDAGSDVFIRAGQFLLNRGARISAKTDTLQNAGDINIEADAINIVQDSSMDDPSLTTKSEASGRGGNITLVAKNVRINSYSNIIAKAESSGNAGSIAITGDAIDISEHVCLNTETEGSGSAGNISIKSGNTLSIVDSVTITTKNDVKNSNTDTNGMAGFISIQSKIIALKNNININTKTEGNGSAGSISILADKIDMQDNVKINSETEYNGNAGDITITGNTINLAENTEIKSKVDAEVNHAILGNAGTIRISGQMLRVKTNTLITTETQGLGSAGDIFLDVTELEIMDNSLVTSKTANLGNAGSIQINAKQITLSNGGSLSVSTEHQGNGGVINIDADVAQILSDSVISSSTEGSGNAGDIQISSNEQISINSGARILASSASSGSGGNITINANQVTIVGRGTTDQTTGLFARATSIGDSGSIQATMSKLQIADGGIISASSRGDGSAGTIRIDASDTITLANGASLKTDSANSGGGGIFVNAINLLHLTNSEISTSVHGGGGDAGNIAIDPKFVILQNSSIHANAFGGEGGSIHIQAQHFFADPNSVVEASSQLGIDGSIEIDAPGKNYNVVYEALPQSFVDPSQLLHRPCDARMSGNSSFIEDSTSFYGSGHELGSEIINNTNSGSMQLNQPDNASLANLSREVTCSSGKEYVSPFQG